MTKTVDQNLLEKVRTQNPMTKTVDKHLLVKESNETKRNA